MLGFQISRADLLDGWWFDLWKNVAPQHAGGAERPMPREKEDIAS